MEPHFPIYANFFIFAPGKIHSDLKKAVAFIILFFFLFNTMGFYLLFELNKFLAKREMQSVIQMHPVHLTILKITDADRNHDFHRIDKREIEYKGKLYDVVREIGNGSTKVFFCLYDSKEENVFAGLKKAHYHKIYLALWEQLSNITFPESADRIDYTSFSELTYPHIIISLKSSLLPTWSPPPEYS